MSSKALAIARAAINHKPSDAQKEAGNYRKGHIRFQGLDVTLENRKGSTRQGVDEHGVKWACRLPADYGYIKRTLGADGDHVDVYIGPDHQSRLVFVINQHDHKSGAFDEHKCMLGFASEREAVETYCQAFSDGKGHCRIGSVEPMTMDVFKHWLKHEDTRSRLDAPSVISKALRIARKNNR